MQKKKEKWTVRRVVAWIKTLLDHMTKHNVGAYAAQAAYFFFLSLIPILLLLLTAIFRYTAFSKAEILASVIQVFPSSVEDVISGIVYQVSTQSSTVLPITILAAFWSSGKGVMAMTAGLNLVYDSKETRNYFFIRFRATLYTLLFIVLIIVSLGLSVFGKTIKALIEDHLPFLTGFIDQLLRTRVIYTTIMLLVFTLLIFKFLPNRRTKIKHELPGTIFTAAGWAVISGIFSVYLDIFTGFTTMYGSMATIILIMLWMYFCMYCFLIGAEINMMVFPKAEEKKAMAGLRRQVRHVIRARRRAHNREQELSEEVPAETIPEAVEITPERSNTSVPSDGTPDAPAGDKPLDKD